MIIQGSSFGEGFIEGWQSVLGKDERPSIIPGGAIILAGKSEYEQGYELGRSLARPGRPSSTKATVFSIQDKLRRRPKDKDVGIT